MSRPNALIGYFGLLNVGMVMIILFYALVGFVGYLKFGEGVLGSITLNLPYYWSVRLYC